jgi:hypothetical protein
MTKYIKLKDLPLKIQAAVKKEVALKSLSYPHTCAISSTELDYSLLGATTPRARANR